MIFLFNKTNIEELFEKYADEEAAEFELKQEEAKKHREEQKLSSNYREDRGGYQKRDYKNDKYNKGGRRDDYHNREET